MSVNRIPLRNEVQPADTWDLTPLFSDDTAWQSAYEKLGQRVDQVKEFEGHLHKKEELLKLLFWLDEIGQQLEQVSQYAFLRHCEDGSESSNQKRLALMQQLSTSFAEATSFLEPEILGLDEQLLTSFLQQEEFAPYRIMLTKMLRFKPHTLSKKEERLLALQREVGGKAQEVFAALTNVDLDFGSIVTAEGKIPLTQSTFGLLLQNKDRLVRQRTYRKFYTVFDKHKHTLTQLYDASVKQNLFRCKARGYESARSMFLFPDHVDEVVYDNLIQSVHDELPLLHRYYHIRTQMLGLKKLAHYDVYVPLIQDIEIHHTYEEAVELIAKALKPLGNEYVATLQSGLLENRWVDRYENKGKRSGAFSSGTFSSPPYILMNYHPQVLRDVFTLAHEGGHSMHSYYSAQNNPFSSYDYTIFEAEVASTFNEQLLADYMIKQADSDELKAYIIGKQLDDVVATLYRQTMFAEFEHLIHAEVERGNPITVDSLRNTYGDLLRLYFGPNVHLLELSSLEALRIPHFYRAFYVYKYATGISAAMALAQMVLHGNEAEKERYLQFLRSGGSLYPLQSLQQAGVDMSQPEPIKLALQTFRGLLYEFEKLTINKA